MAVVSEQRSPKERRLDVELTAFKLISARTPRPRLSGDHRGKIFGLGKRLGIGSASSPVFRFPNCTCYAEQMRDVVEYLRAYRAYVSANLGWGKALRFALVWLAGMFAPLASKTLLELPNWVAVTWMIVWAFLGYIFATECGNIIALRLRAQVS